MEKVNRLSIVLFSLMSVAVLFSTLLLAARGVNNEPNKCTVICKDGSKASCEGENTTTFKEKDDEGCKCDDEVVRCSDNVKKKKNNNTNTTSNSTENNKNGSNGNANRKNHL